MTELKAGTLVICCAAVLCSIFEVICPNGKMEKVIQMVLGLFMVSSILISIQSITCKLHFDSLSHKPANYKDCKFKEAVNEQLRGRISQKMKEIVLKILKENEIEAKKVDIIMDTKEDNCISIKNIGVILNRGDVEKKHFVKKVLEERLDITTHVDVGSD